MHGNVSKNNGFDLNKQIIDAIDEKVEALIALKYILTVQKNNPNGVAGLDENGKILNSQIPDDVKNGLSSNDFTDDLKSKLDNLSNYDDTAVKALITNEANKREEKDYQLAEQISSNKSITDAEIAKKVDKENGKALSSAEYVMFSSGANEKGGYVISVKQVGKAEPDMLSVYPTSAMDSLLSDKVDKADDMGLSKIKNISKTEQPCIFDDNSSGFITSVSFIDQDDTYKNILFYEQDTLDTLLSKKTDKPTLSNDTESISIDTNSGNKVNVLTAKGVTTLVSGKQDKLTFDDVPTANSDNPVKSEGILAELNKKANKANNFGGFEGGSRAGTQAGGAVGDYAVSSIGGAVGSAAKTIMGGSIGADTISGNGFSGGFGARTIKDNTVVDAVQLGTGINPNEKTLQVYSYQLMDSTGHIPNDRMPTKSDKTTYYNPTTGNAITYDLKNEHNRMTSYINVPTAATSVAISVSDGAYRNDYISGLSFYTGSTPPEVSYPSSPYIMRWIGSECTTSGESSVFSPIANRVYDIIFYFNGGYIIGLVNGYDDISQQGA